MAEADRFVGKLLAGTYQVVRLIGKGGMGAIYEATHARLQSNRYAIKVLAQQLTDEPELLVRFRREAEIASQLGHDNIVAVHDFNVADGQAYMVMELLEGEDLAARLRARGALSVDEVKRIVDQVVSALDAAHRAQIVHRDLKPSNIFLCRRAGHHDHVKVLDFGVSKVLDSSSVVTHDHALVGTPFYMSPEQADGRVKEIDSRTDVFALGAIIWEMLTGRMAFAAPTLSVALYKVCMVDPPDVHAIRNDVPPAVSLVLRRALAKERHQRTPSVAQVAAELAAALHGIMPAGLPPPAAGGQASVVGFASPMAPLGSARTPAAVGLLPTVASYPGAQLPAIPAISEHAAASAAGWPAAIPPPTGSIAPGAGSMAVGSMVVQPRSSRGVVALAIVGLAAVVLGVGTWAVMSRTTSGPTTTTTPPTAPASPAEPGPGSAVIAKPTAPSGTDVIPASTPTPGPSTTPTTPTEVVLFLAIEPPDAKPEITIGDKKVTEHLVHVPRSDTRLALTATAAGFATYRSDVLPDRDQRVPIVLKRKAGKLSPTATRTAPTKPSPDATARTAPPPPSPAEPAAHPAPTTPGSQAGSASPAAAPTQPAAVAVTPPAGATPAPGAPPPPAAQPRPVPPLLPPPAPVPQPQPPKTGTIFDQ